MSGHPAAEFLRQALDQAEQLARAATPGPWAALHRIDGSHRVIGGAHPMPGAATDNRCVHRDDDYPTDSDVVHPAADADHIALHDPVAVLRRVAADRQSLALHEPFRALGVVRCRQEGLVHDLWPCRTVLLLAEAWGWTEDAS